MGKRIYVVEDDRDIADIIGIVLGDAGYEITVSSTVGAFKKLLETGYPDLVLLDIMLPDGNGIELCRQLKDRRSLDSVPIILMSANSSGKEAIQKSGADDFVAKPFDINDLALRIGARVQG